MGSIRTHTSFGLVVVGLVVLSVVSTFAQDGGRTRGDAEAVFHAQLTGGAAILAHNPEAQGTPAQFPYPPAGFPNSIDGVRILAILDGFTYCDSGWHLVSMSWVEAPVDFASRLALFDYLSAIDIQIALDGVALEVERTPITAVTDAERIGYELMFGINVGAFLAPGTLTVGGHDLVITISVGRGNSFSLFNTFTIVPC